MAGNPNLRAPLPPTEIDDLREEFAEQLRQVTAHFQAQLDLVKAKSVLFQYRSVDWVVVTTGANFTNFSLSGLPRSSGVTQTWQAAELQERTLVGRPIQANPAEEIKFVTFLICFNLWDTVTYADHLVFCVDLTIQQTGSQQPGVRRQQYFTFPRISNGLMQQVEITVPCVAPVGTVPTFDITVAPVDTSWHKLPPLGACYLSVVGLGSTV